MIPNHFLFRPKNIKTRGAQNLKIKEEDIINECLKGKQEAFSRFYDIYSGVLFSLCLRYAKNRADAEDILQEGFILIFKNLKQYKFNGSFEGWLKRIMANTALGYYRRKNVIQYTDQLFLMDTRPDYHESAIEKISNKELIEIIQKLPFGCRTVFNMYAIEGYSHKEIAETLNISVGTSKSQLFDARKLLKKHLESLNVKEAREKKSTLLKYG